MLLAAIDIGTNAVRLYFSNVFRQNGQIQVEKASLLRIPIRLGEDVFTTQRISEKKIDQLSKTMQAFKLLIEVYEPVAWKACATAAMREAVNKDEIIGRIAEDTGVLIDVIDGQQEASLISAFRDLHLPFPKKYIMYIDVGGGSTEISILKGKEIISSESFRIGTIRLMKQRVEEQEWKNLKNWLQSHKSKTDNMLLLGSGGNINKITKLYGRIPDNILTISQLEYGLEDLSRYSVEERIQRLGMRPDRADVIIPAGEVFRYIMRQIKAGLIYVPKIGLSDGMVSTLFIEQNDR